MGISALFYTNGELMYRIYIDKGYHTQIFRANLGGAGEAMMSGTQGSMGTWTKAMPGRRIWILKSLSSQNWFRK